MWLRPYSSTHRTWQCEQKQPCSCQTTAHRRNNGLQSGPHSTRFIRPTHRLPHAVQPLRLTHNITNSTALPDNGMSTKLHTAFTAATHTCYKPPWRKARSTTNLDTPHMQNALWGTAALDHNPKAWPAASTSCCQSQTEHATLPPTQPYGVQNVL